MDRFNLRGILRENIRQRIPEDGRVFVATGGVDSISLVASCIDAGYTPIIASFTLDDRESTDFVKAREAAKFFGVEFAPILLPTNRDFIAKSVLQLIQLHGARKKVDIECMYPFLYLIESVAKLGATDLVSGFGAGYYFCLTKQIMISLNKAKKRGASRREIIALLRAERERCYSPNPAVKKQFQRNLLYRFSQERGIRFHDPWWINPIYKLFLNCDWDELNRPRTKEPMRCAFPEMDALRLPPPTNLQLGDSGIAQLVSETIRERYTPKAKSSVSAYNWLAKHLTRTGVKDGRI